MTDYYGADSTNVLMWMRWLGYAGAIIAGKERVQRLPWHCRRIRIPHITWLHVRLFSSNIGLWCCEVQWNVDGSDYLDKHNKCAMMVMDYYFSNVRWSFPMSRIPGPIPSDLVVKTDHSIGKRLLRQMGWREGHGVGPRMRRKRKGTITITTTFIISAITIIHLFCQLRLKQQHHRRHYNNNDFASSSLHNHIMASVHHCHCTRINFVLIITITVIIHHRWLTYDCVL